MKKIAGRMAPRRVAGGSVTEEGGLVDLPEIQIGLFPEEGVLH